MIWFSCSTWIDFNSINHNKNKHQKHVRWILGNCFEIFPCFQIFNLGILAQEAGGPDKKSTVHFCYNFYLLFLNFEPWNCQKISKWWEMTWLLFVSDRHKNKCKWGSGSKLKYGGINTKWIFLHSKNLNSFRSRLWNIIQESLYRCK